MIIKEYKNMTFHFCIKLTYFKVANHRQILSVYMYYLIISKTALLVELNYVFENCRKIHMSN